LRTTKLVALSDNMRFALPLRLKNLLSAAINAFVVRSLTNSKWTALVDRHTKIEMYILILLRLRCFRSFIQNGPQ